MAKETEHITMLQRSPTYIVSQPSKDWFANLARKLLPQKLAYKVSRAKNIWWQNIVYKTARNKPEKTKKQIFKMTRKSLGQDKNYDLDPHFVPAYNPWEQRLCVVPDNDLYESIKAGEASIITDHIDTLTPKGIKLRSGTHLDCDLIVKATGINVIVLAQGAFSVDGHPVDFSKTFTYEGMMFSDVPNMISTFGYVNASWTLRADLISEYMCRIVNHMEETGTVQATPRAPEGMEGKPWITTFNPGYINRVLDQMPMQGDREPWVNTQDYKRDKKVLPSKPIDDGFMEFSNPADVNTASVAAE
jgi:cation diffusion facilitator CzcD-associated flavoprotein CzcO